MTETLKYGKTFNYVVLTYLILVIILTLAGKLTFGNGLGDLLVIIYIAIVVVIQGVLIIIYARLKLNNIFSFVTAIIFLSIAMYVTWKFTLGRGIEHSWDGSIFY